MKAIAEQVGARIRYLRTQKELSQEKLALEAGLNPSFLGHIERGLKSPTVDTLFKISSALNISLSELVDISKNKTSNDYSQKLQILTENLSEDEYERVAHIVSEIIKFNKL